MRHAILSTLIVATASAQDSETWYPTRVGTTWVIEMDGVKRTCKVTRHEKVGADTCAVIETFEGDVAVSSEHLVVRKDGVYRSKLNTLAFDPPLCVLKLPAKKGNTWKYTGKLGEGKVTGTFTTSEEEIEVPSGMYKAFVVASTDFVDAGGRSSVAYAFAEGVGLVRQTGKDSLGAYTMVLKEFKKP